MREVELKPLYRLIDHYIIKGRYSLAKENLDHFRNIIPKEKLNFYDSVLEKKLGKEVA